MSADDLKAAPDPPDYPHDWTPAQRQRAYWAAIDWGFPNTTAGWTALLNQAHRRRDHITKVVTEARLPYKDD